jgi:hypothetical protein
MPPPLSLNNKQEPHNPPFPGESKDFQYFFLFLLKIKAALSLKEEAGLFHKGRRHWDLPHDC